jgi:Ca2+-binding EF-hand superfamily protein
MNEIEKGALRKEYSEFLLAKQTEKKDLLFSKVMTDKAQEAMQSADLSKENLDVIDNNNNSETSDKIYDSVVTNEGNVNDKNSTLGEEKTTVQIQSAARQKQPAALIENMKSEEKDAIDSLLAEREVHENLNILKKNEMINANDTNKNNANINTTYQSNIAQADSNRGKSNRNVVLKSLFQMFDEDNDDYLNKSEFFLAYKKLIESDVITDEELSGIFQHFDDNHNGLVDFEEFKKHFGESIDFDDAALILEDEKVLKSTLETMKEEQGKARVWPELDLAVENCSFYTNLLHNESVMDEQNLRIFTCTWNMHGKKAPDIIQLRKILPPNMCHLYVIGTQECERTAAQSVYSFGKLKFPKMVKECLGKDYFLVHGEALAAIQCVVFAHVSLKDETDKEDAGGICHHNADVVATGIGNTFGNKGGVGISVIIGKTSFLFISAHLAAHQHKVHERNEHFKMINQKLNLHRPDFVPMVEIGTGNDVSDRFHHVFWLGDFNYRINGTRDAVDKMLSLNMHDKLLENDQLRIEQSKGNVFQRFNEGPLNFRPTYKFDKKSDVYDTSRKQRIPAWTDRILWRSNGGHAIDLIAYDCENSVKISDHRAVRAIFNIPSIVNTDTSGEVQRQRRNTKFGRHDSQICSVM